VRFAWMLLALGCSSASGDAIDDASSVDDTQVTSRTDSAIADTQPVAMDSSVVDTTVVADTPPAAACGTMVAIPAGVFTMGASLKDDPLSYPKERPQHEVTLSAFEIDRCEVTTADYRVCVMAGKCTAPKTTEGCNWNIAGRDNHPINCVQWEQANAYCAFVGKRLPSEAEWEKAARGTDARLYPWGNSPAPDCSHAWIDNNGGTVDGGEGCGMSSTAPVGTKPLGASPYGVQDMLGNVWEWTNDWYQLDYYAVSPPNDPKGPATGTTKVYRGIGWWDANDRMLRLTFRTDETLMYKRNNQGFRCAK
jgi:formylglycine-generating enzyme required for sulfatase activity